MRRTDIFVDLFGGSRTRGRICTRCGGRHRDAGGFKWCKVCRDLSSATHLVWRHDHIARKLCPECGQAKGHATKRCERHREYINAWQRAAREKKRDKGLCTWGRCRNACEGWLCERHAQRRWAA